MGFRCQDRIRIRPNCENRIRIRPFIKIFNINRIQIRSPGQFYTQVHEQIYSCQTTGQKKLYLYERLLNLKCENFTRGQ